MINKSKIIVISGPSGVGKGAIISKLLTNSYNIELTVSATTRQKREGEIEGKHYYFLNHTEFSKRIEDDQFLEYCKVHDNFYGTLKSELKRIQDLGKTVLIEMDIQGAQKIKSHMSEALFIFIAPPSMEELEKRLRSRNTESEESIQKRLQTAKLELQSIRGYNSVIVNDCLEKAIHEVKDIINIYN